MADKNELISAEQSLLLQNKLEDEANRITKVATTREKVKHQEEDGYDGFTDTKLKLIPTPNFTDCRSVGTMLPINMASETVSNLSKYAEQFDFVDFIKEKLGYASRIKVSQSFASEQVDALVLAIKSYEENNAFILGDMMGIGKGRVCAGMMRFAFQQKLTPVFITQKTYLFSDIYRDLKAIDGFGTTPSGKLIMPYPFILNGNEPEESSIKDRSGKIMQNPLKPVEIMEICETLKMPSLQKLKNILHSNAKSKERNKDIQEFNCVFLSYSQISSTRKETKQNFLLEIAPTSFFVFDESHNAASANANSRIMKRATPIVENCAGLIFSSATYAKTPDVFGLYVIRTALRTAVPSLKSITDALKVGGENVSEYIASGLVKEGQMIRRERSFGDCKKVTDYVGTDRAENEKGEAVYTELPDDTQRAFYDEAIGYFKELRDFSTTELAKNSIYTAIVRKCDDINIPLVPQGAFAAIDKNKGEDKASFIKSYRNKWMLTYSPDSIGRYKATFRENLFLAIKAKFAADKVIECLTTPQNYKNIDGTLHFAPLKPLIAIKNTGEAIFNELDLRDGDEIENNFSEYLRAVYRKLFSGKFLLRKVDNNIFDTIEDLTERGIITPENKRNFLLDEEYEVTLSDFLDNGTQISEIQSRLNNYNTQLPLSVIDYMREMITSVERPALYYKEDEKINPKYGQARDTYFKFAEATGRKCRLEKSGGNLWVYRRIDKISTTKIFQDFNNGAIDVMLLNVTASTGGSAQSSPDEGSDTRPRNMFIVQFEGDINIEVQKRGRVNRTGQLNSPTYTYVISKIPVELRTYLMFRKKLRKLDANTSANQTASSETSEITDDKGKAIEDIFNAYGFRAFTTNFIELPENVKFLEVFEGMRSISFASAPQAEAEKNEKNAEQFNAFVRELELYPCSTPIDTSSTTTVRVVEVNQEYFFNQMNEKYISLVEELIQLDQYQLELESKNYKAALKQRVVIQLNSGSTVFSLPLYLADYFTLDDNRAWTKDMVMRKASELATTSEGKTLELATFHKEFIRDYTAESMAFRDAVLKAMDEKRPKKQDFPVDVDYPESSPDYDIALAQFTSKRYAKEQKEKTSRDNMLDFIRFFTPLKPVILDGNLGYFVGYKIQDAKTKFKYSDGNIEFIFCFLSRLPVLHTKITSGLTLSSIRTQTINNFSYKSKQYDADMAAVTNWTPDYNKRIVRRFLTGNILSGIMEANLKQEKDEIVDWNLVRYTNIDGSIATSVELKFSKPLSETTIIQPQNTVLGIACDNDIFFDAINQMPYTYGDATEFTVIWNAESDIVIDRSVVIFKRDMVVNRIPYSRLYVQFVEQYTENKDTGVIAPLDAKQKRVSALFRDDTLYRQYENTLITKTGAAQIKRLPYAVRRTQKVDKYGNSYEATQFGNVAGWYVNTFVFDLNAQVDEMRNFFSDLYKKFQVSFNFRSDASAYLNEAARGDIFDETLVTETKQKVFDKGEYRYIFIKKVPDNVIQAIPNLIDPTYDTVNGGVLLSFPLMPQLLPAYNLKPYKLSNEVMVKLVFSALSDANKTEFLNRLKDESANKDALGVGLFVQSYLSAKSVPAIYFFGDLRIPDYGLIMKEYATNPTELDKIIFEEVAPENVITKKESKTKVTFDDAERFLMALL